ncbi:MAG: hypothetical protein AB7S80_19970 [Rhizobiaceae bacterium]
MAQGEISGWHFGPFGETMPFAGAVVLGHSVEAVQARFIVATPRSRDLAICDGWEAGRGIRTLLE